MSPPLSELSIDLQYPSDGYEHYYDAYSSLVPTTAPSDFYTSENLYMYPDADGFYHWTDGSAARSDGCMEYSFPLYHAPTFASETLAMVCLSRSSVNVLTTLNSLPTLLTNTVTSRSLHSLRLPMIHHTHTICPSRSPVTRPVLKLRTIARASPLLATIFSHRPLLFSVMGTHRHH